MGFPLLSFSFSLGVLLILISLPQYSLTPLYHLHSQEMPVDPSIAATHYFPASQLQGLQAIYDSLSGYQWYWSQPYQSYGYPWSFGSVASTNPCSPVHTWQGIFCNSTCINEPCTVTIIDLQSRLLVGKSFSFPSPPCIDYLPYRYNT